jgi:hypothetical protein
MMFRIFAVSSTGWVQVAGSRVAASGTGAAIVRAGAHDDYQGQAAI